LVAGTHGLQEPRAWWRPRSDFALALEAHGHQLVNRDRAFVWPTDLEGLWPWRRRRLWAVAGETFGWYVQAYLGPGTLPSVIAHSHGGSVVAYAAFFGQQFDLVVTMASPVRGDMAEAYQRLRARARRWIHVYTTWDLWQALGGVFDGRLGIYREQPLADQNVQIDADDHGYVTPEQWTKHGLWPFLDAP
jgi:hypothetical protein